MRSNRINEINILFCYYIPVSYTHLDVYKRQPLAYMRGRTLENAFVILDEAQNTTAEQMRCV